MPPRADIRSVMVLGSGPIVIGQACEFDYSGTQACRVLRSLGYRVVLLNSNPATIMTDPEVADATYVEPLTRRFARQVIERERPDALLPTLGGQTALNLALELHDAGDLDEFGVEMLGARPEAIRTGEDREAFRRAMERIGLRCPEAGIARSLDEAEAVLRRVGLPAIIRPSFTLGGTGGGIAYNADEFREIVARGLELSPVGEVLVEESVLGWKEFELEVMRDRADDAIVVCSIENVDPMGVHTGDSITVAPALTLTDREYQRLRDMAIAVLREVGVETGGSNIQFAVHPRTGEVRVIEMNPRVSRSSALASKATGFPIAKIAAQLAVGMTLDEIPNDITRVTPACFEPALDYVVVKVPRWNFDKFAAADRTLGTSMKAVGEVMAIGRTFGEAFLKALDSLEARLPDFSGAEEAALRRAVSVPTPERPFAVLEALRRGMPVEEVAELSGIDPWFLDEMAGPMRALEEVRGRGLTDLDDAALRRLKRLGLSDARIAAALGVPELAVRERREGAGLRPVFKRVDTCAAEFESHTPYLYATYEDEDEAGDDERERVVVLGNGPNRIGQGLEFDTACVHAAQAARAMGLAAVMVNCNPETVSTDYDTSDKLYFEPVTAERVRDVVARERPRGVVLQFGGQTPLKLAREVGPVLGTSPDAIDLCEDRDRFDAFVEELGIRRPPGTLARTRAEALAAAERIGPPLLVRPSYVLGGRAMRICHDVDDLRAALDEALGESEDRPVLMDRFLDRAVEYDVDAVCDGERVAIAGIMEHVEAAGVHSGDSAAVLPPVRLSPTLRDEIEEVVRRVALRLGVVGLLNVQLAVQRDVLYVLEVNPRASRTVPFVSKATGIPWARVAMRVVLGERLADMQLERRGRGLYFIKAPVFPWSRFPGSDVVLGPEMRSTGEVMGVGWSFGEAYAKALIAAGMRLPLDGGVFLSVRDEDKPEAIGIAGSLVHMGYTIWATRGTRAALERAGIPARLALKVGEGRPDVVDHIKNGEIQLMVNTPLGRKAFYDERAMRLAGLRYGVACITTIEAGRAVVSALRSLRAGELRALKLQEIPPGDALSG